MDLDVDGLVFDLDDTLFDFRGAFAGVVGDFYEQHLSTTASVTRADAVAMMIRWDEDLHTVTQYVPDLRARRFARWLSEWPETGFDIGGLTEWYDHTMDQQVQPDPQINRLLGHLNDRQIPCRSRSASHVVGISALSHGAGAPPLRLRVPAVAGLLVVVHPLA